MRQFIHYTNVKKCVIIYRYYEKNNKGDYNMSKVKQWAEDTAEQSVDMIIKQLKDGQIDLDTAKKNIMNVDNLQFLGINYDNVDEVIEENAHA